MKIKLISMMILALASHQTYAGAEGEEAPKNIIPLEDAVIVTGVEVPGTSEIEKKKAKARGWGSVAVGQNAQTGEDAESISAGGGAESVVKEFIAGDNSVAVGSDAHARTGNSISVGAGSKAGTQRYNFVANKKQKYIGEGITIGVNSSSEGVNLVEEEDVYREDDKYKYYSSGIVIGNNSRVAAASVAYGTKANVLARDSVGVGDKVNINNESISAVAIGSNSSVFGVGSVAIGSGAKVKTKFFTFPGTTTPTNMNATAIGNDAFSERIGSVSLGAYSKSHRGVTIPGFNEDDKYGIYKEVPTRLKERAPYSKTKLTFVQKWDQVYASDNKPDKIGPKLVVYGTVSVGGAHSGKGFGRQIVNLADGTEATDAVNLRQLQGLEKILLEKIDNLNTAQAAIKVQGDEGASYKLDSTLTVNGGKVNDNKNINVVADTTNRKLEIQLNNDLKGLDSIELVPDKDAKPPVDVDSDNVKIKIDNKGFSNGYNKIVQVANGTAKYDAVNFGQLQELEEQIRSKEAGIKVKADIVDKDKIKDTDDFTSVVIGGGVTDKEKLVDKSVGVSVTKDKNGAAQFDVKVAEDLNGMNSITFGPQPEKGQPDNRVSISAEKGLDNGGHKITNVAAGTAPTDAVNVGQLDSRIASSEHRMRKYANAGTASAMAAANIPQAYVPGHSALGVGLGYSHGQSALAVGVSTINDKGDWIFKGSASVNSEGGVFGAGASYMW